MKYILPIFTLLLFSFVASSSVFAYSFNPPDEKTGAPNEGTCMDCHAGNSLNASGGSLMLTVPDTYSPGIEYDLIVSLARNGQKRWGFQMTALNNNGSRAGTFATADGNTQLTQANSKQYIQHNTSGTAQGTNNSNEWMFKWTAPSTNVGPISFYAAGNAANDDSGTSGDYIYTQNATSETIAYGVELTGVGSLTKEKTATSNQIRYTLRVKNSGNTNDTIRLSTSGDATATLSPTTVTLAPGASRSITLNVNGTGLTAGDYAVKVTATSQGDSNKTDEITTTTTIPAVYGVTLTGIGDLTSELNDASTGVSYRFRVRNTGNTSDTIRLSTSGDVSGTLSPATVFLASGASRNITLTVSGTSLKAAGDYEVKVSAVSRGDSTKTAEITTTTTVQPVYGVTLTGIGNLTKELTNAGFGVIYSLKVTNNGNTSDTIRLSTSGNVSARLSQTSVQLASNGTTNITLTISGASLKAAGDYKVKVTATSQGDSTKKAEVETATTILPVYGVTLAGVGELTTETSDASDGVAYKFTVTNTGNTDDTIDLSSSGSATATLSQTSVTLASGTSAEVTLTISAAELTTAGDYSVILSATSQGDDTQTAEVSTTTTILPVHGVTIAGVGELTTETTDASDGISYKFTVANTGNTDDVIDLSSSGSATATLSQTSVTLASETSTEVTLTISAAELTTAGDYSVILSATSQGDNTQTAEVSTTTTILPVYGVTIAGVGELTTETSDASDGVAYKFTVANTGNTDDVIDLSSSGSATATLSQTSVTLASETSTEVTLTISAAELTTAGNYSVILSATSQGDNTQTADVSTTTTILPVYGVTIAGVGELTTETTDASDGVTYKFTVTNTGNTEDIIDLSTSGSATATLSQTSVTLASEASAEVTLTIAGAALTTAGDYGVIVSATSQGDSTKTSEVSTTTTILPVYGVTLAGVGELTTETSDTSEGVAYKFTVTNTGNTEDIIDLSTSGGTTATLSQTSVTLASGTSAEVTLTISAAELTTAGDYSVILSATSQGDNTQTADVSTTTTILPVYGVTLAGVGELTTETSDTSEGVAYKFTVTNTSNTEDIIDLSTSGGTTATLSQTSVTLASEASTEVTLTISAAELTTAGDYSVIVSATSQGDSTKTSEVSTTTTILPVYGVTLAGVGELTTETSDASDGVAYKFTVTNTGNTEDIIDLSSSGGATATLSQTSVTLASGTSGEVTLTISAAELTTAGDYSVIVTATSQGDSTKTADVSTTTSILPVYGVRITGVQKVTTETPETGEDVSYQFTVRNTGNTDDTIQISTSDDTTVTLSQTIVSLTSGESVEVTLTISAAVLTTAGDYEVIVTATSQGDTGQTTQTTISTTIDPVYGIKFQVDGGLQGSTSDIIAGVSYTLTVTNTGNFKDTIVVGSSAEVGIEGSVLGVFTTSSNQGIPTSQVEIMLEPGASETLIFTAAGDSITKPGVYDIIVQATSQGDYSKSIELTITTTILPVYGITITDVEMLTPEQPDTSEDVNYTLKVTNTGNTDDVIDLSSSGNAQSTLSQDSVSLASGTSAKVTLTIPAAALTTAGNYEVIVTATSQGDATTIVTIVSITIEPVYGVMLDIEGERQGATTDVLAGIIYTLTITNTGNIEDTVVVGSSAEFGIEGSVLGAFTASNDQEIPTSQVEIMLEPGASETVIFTAAGDFFTKPGVYDIIVQATSQGDNSKSIELTITTTIDPVVWDLNADGEVNILDLVQVTNQFGESGEGLAGDVNMDGEVNILDLVQVANYIGKTQAEIVQLNQ